MAKNKDEVLVTEPVPALVPDDTAPTPALVELIASAPVPEIRVEPRISFDVWFQCRDRTAAGCNQPHHKIGMYQFASTKGKKTKTEWDRAFAAY